MLGRRCLVLTGAAGFAAPTLAQPAQTAITVSYALPLFFREVTDSLVARFRRENPDIPVQLRAPAEDYGVHIQQVLRDAVAGTLPDVGFHGMNWVRLLAERGLAQPLDPFLGEEGGGAIGPYGLPTGTLTLGRWGDRQVGIPYAMSMPILFVNADLLRASGSDPDTLPQDWDGWVRLATRANDRATGQTGLWLTYNVDDWTWQGMVNGAGGRMVTEDERRVAFDGPAGQLAIKTLGRLASEGGMPSLPRAQAVQAFSAGRLGVFGASSGLLEVLSRQSGGRFEIRTAAMPMPSPEGTLPTGGTVGFVFARDPAWQRAAWRFLRFMVGAEAQAEMARATDLLPTNRIAAERPDLLGGFYAGRPAYGTALSLIPRLRPFYAWPGPNGVKIIDVIKDRSEEVVSLRTRPADALRAMASDVQALLPGAA